MKKVLLFAITTTLCSTISTAQITGKQTKGPITLSNGLEVNIGDTLHWGAGTTPYGDFKYVYQPMNVLIGLPERSLSRQYSGMFAIVRSFKIQKIRNAGDKTIAVVNPFGGINYMVDLNPAIEVGEITAINTERVGPVPISAAKLISGGSVADELLKLKALLDAGAISQQEYDTQKAKLLK